MAARVAAKTLVAVILAGKRATVVSRVSWLSGRGTVGCALARARRAVSVVASEVAKTNVVAGLSRGVGTAVALLCECVSIRFKSV